jgi:hypothetical protein
MHDAQESLRCCAKPYHAPTLLGRFLVLPRSLLTAPACRTPLPSRSWCLTQSPPPLIASPLTGGKSSSSSPLDRCSCKSILKVRGVPSSRVRSPLERRMQILEVRGVSSSVVSSPLERRMRVGDPRAFKEGRRTEGGFGSPSTFGGRGKLWLCLAGRPLEGGGAELCSWGTPDVVHERLQKKKSGLVEYLPVLSSSFLPIP